MKKSKICLSLILVLSTIFSSATFSKASKQASNMIVNVNSGVVEVMYGETSEPLFEYDETLCKVVSKKEGNSTTITVNALKTNRSWKDKVCKIYLPTTTTSLKVKTRRNGITTVSDINVDLNITDRGFTTVVLPSDYSADLNVVTAGITNVTVPEDIDSATVTSNNRGYGLVWLPFDDCFFFSRRYKKVIGDGEQSYNFEAQGIAMLTVAFDDE